MSTAESDTPSRVSITRSDQHSVRSKGSVTYSPQQRRHYLLPKEPVFDGANSPQNIAISAFGLGTVFGIGVACTLLTDQTQLGLLFTVLPVFHLSEYLITALYNPGRLNIDSIHPMS
jgi:hypothetical protein